MSASLTLPELPAEDFHARITRRDQARGLAAPPIRAGFAKRLGVVAAALAIPALAAPGSLLGPSHIASAAPVVTPMGFEIPGESFPGSAFYYLEDTPELLAEPNDFAAGIDGSGIDGPGTNGLPSAYPHADAASAYTGPAARPLRVVGSADDHARAQQCLTMAIYYEAASESDAGQRAVAQVVLNRVAHPTFPTTICGVVFEGSERQTGCQFSFTCDGSLNRQPSRAFWNRAGRIARRALAGSVYAPVGLATHYHTLAVHPHWAPSLDRVAVIGAHQFYSWPGRPGTLAAFSSRYRGGEPLARRNGVATDTELMDRAMADLVIPATASPALGWADSPAPAGSARPSATSASAPAQTGAQTGAQASAPPAGRLPSGGSVRSEYARSGAWRTDTPAPEGNAAATQATSD